MALALIPHLALVSLSLLSVACGGGGGVRVTDVAPRADDVATIDGLMRAFYAVVNVGPREPRQWDRDRTLYAPWIRFVATGRRVDVMTHQQLVDGTEPMIASGFRERELRRVVRQVGAIAHVFSSYETERGTGAEVTRSRGVNSLELYFDGRRWWIAAVSWHSETADQPIPPELLP